MPDSLIEDYKTSLKDLTLNSRPIIDNLTTIAKENSQVADEILSLITDRIYQTRPDYKLYALYLLDSICKTIGNPYNILVGDDLFAIFSHIFQLGNEQTRSSLIKVFETWKQTRTRGSALPLFPPQQLDQIQTFLTKAGYPKKPVVKPIDDSQIQLINNINNLIPIFHTKITMNPHDIKIKDRFQALNKLKTLLSSQKLKPSELQAIQLQLNNIKEQELNSSSSSSSPPPASVATVDNEKCQELFKKLINSGIVKLNQAPIPGSKPIYQVQLPKIKYIKPSMASNLLDEIAAFSKNIPRTDYDKVKFNHLILLSKSRNQNFQNFIKSNKIDSSLTDLLYSAKSYKCGLCGKRFTTDAEGATNKRLHLDWHFRINKKLSTNSNVQSRNWYLDDFEWVKFKDEELLEFATVDEKKSSIKDSATTATPIVDIPFVIVPANDNNMNNRCIFCRENIKATYNEDNGEWCWFNCIRAPGEGPTSRKIMHVSCFNEANKKRSNDDPLGGIEKKIK